MAKLLRSSATEVMNPEETTALARTGLHTMRRALKMRVARGQYGVRHASLCTDTCTELCSQILICSYLPHLYHPHLLTYFQDELDSKEVVARLKCSSEWCSKEYSRLEVRKYNCTSRVTVISPS